MSNEQINDYIDRRLVIKFSTLTEMQEKVITNELISFIYYYYLKTGISKDPSSDKMLEYYINNIKKPKSIQKIMEDFHVQVDAMNYIQETYEMVILIMFGVVDDRQKAIIDKTMDYDRSNYLKAMKYLLDKNKENKEVKAIIDYLRRHNIADVNISNNYINRIINKVFHLV